MIRYFITKLEPKHKIKDYTITFYELYYLKKIDGVLIAMPYLCDWNGSLTSIFVDF